MHVDDLLASVSIKRLATSLFVRTEVEQIASINLTWVNANKLMHDAWSEDLFISIDCGEYGYVCQPWINILSIEIGLSRARIEYLMLLY